MAYTNRTPNLESYHGRRTVVATPGVCPILLAVADPTPLCVPLSHRLAHIEKTMHAHHVATPPVPPTSASASAPSDKSSKMSSSNKESDGALSSATGSSSSSGGSKDSSSGKMLYLLEQMK